MIKETLAAADALAESGIEAAVIDVATLKPLDMTTILRSVEASGRCVIVHEAALAGGVGAEIAARLADEGLTSLLAPVRRVAGYDTVMPLPRLEAHYLPDSERILAAARETLEFA
jgi:pyruvate dehydrogenase E1 component beta subunit